MKIGVVAELTGGADICVPVTDLATLAAVPYLSEGEVALFGLISAKEEYAFTNEALVAVCGDSAASTKRTVKRFDYQSNEVRNVRFETSGVADRDCELKFAIGTTELSIDVAKAEAATAQRYYRVLQALSRAQHENARAWEFAKLALDASVRSTTNTTTAVVDEADAVHTWYTAVFNRTNPRCYRSVLEPALLL